MTCPCNSNLPYNSCCEIIHHNLKEAATAEQLMRSRYSAFVIRNIDFLFDSFHPSTRKFQNKKDIEQWAKENKWMQLDIISSSHSIVEFKAHFLDAQLEPQVHHEKSNFKQVQGIWYYYDGMLMS